MSYLRKHELFYRILLIKNQHLSYTCIKSIFSSQCLYLPDVYHSYTAIVTSTIMVTLLLIFAMILFVQIVAAAKIPFITYGNGQETCLSIEQRNIALQKMKDNVCQYLFNRNRYILPRCGEGRWYRIAYLNMTDPSQQCPSAWREYNTSQFRACGRPVFSGASRPSQIFPISHQYSKVCGRVIGIQVASPDAFHTKQGTSINEGYTDGVSITHGSPRHHIWSYVGSVDEVATNHNACPCGYSGATQPQSFVDNNYYCESGNPNQEWVGQVFPNDKLWDGEQCSHEGTCCTGTNTPPWFSVNLGSPTSDDIEVRIMGSESTTNEDTPIELLEIYVQ